MKRLIFLIFFFIFCAFVFRSVLFHWQQDKLNVIKINGVRIYVEIAKTPEERSLGLSYRRALPENQGMLFIFPTKSYQTFWMKGMNFDLDFIWISDSKVVDITENVPSQHENVPDEALPIYRSKVSVEAMLEVNSGFVVNYKIKIGDTIILNLEDK